MGFFGSRSAAAAYSFAAVTKSPLLYALAALAGDARAGAKGSSSSGPITAGTRAAAREADGGSGN
jgi:hypothetical protein